MTTPKGNRTESFKKVFFIPILMVLMFFALVSCDVAPIVEAPPTRIEKEAKAEEKTAEVVFEEDSGEGLVALTLGVNLDGKALYSNHNITYDSFLLTTEYLSDRRDGSTITGLFSDFKIPSGSDGSRSDVNLGYFTQGKWKVSVKAVNSDGDVLYVGSVETYITAGQKNSVEISMQENTADVGRITLDVMSLTVPLPRVVVTYTKVWNGSGEKTLLDTAADGKGLVMETLDNGYTTYKTPEITMPAGAYWIKVQLWAGEDLFSGEVLDTYIVPRKTTTISGIFTITGLADFIRVNPDERFTFCEACSRFEIPTGKMITGFHLLGSTGLVDFPYQNTTDLLQYLIPVYEDVSTYFNLSGSNELSLAVESYPYKYAGFNQGYPDSPVAFSASLFAGTDEENKNTIEAVYSPSTVIIGEKTFEYSNIEEVRFGNINTIGERAFYGADSFSNFGETIFTNGITIGTSAFEKSGIAYVDIPSGATVGTALFKDAANLFRCSFYPPEIPVDTFNGCTSLTQVNLNNDTKNIGNNAFKNCSALESVIIPEAITTIGTSAFENCSSLTKTLSIGSKIKTIGENAFKGCDNIDELYIAVTCGDLAGEPWGLADKSKITYWAYKLYFDSNLPADYEKAEGEEEFPMLRERFGELLPTPVADPKYRLIGYNDVVGNTLCGYEIPIPIIDGYALRGWFTDPAAGEEVTQLTVNRVKENRTVYAHWVRGLVTVVFSGGRGGSGDTGKSTQTYRMVRYQGYYGYIGEEDEEDDYASPLPTATIAGRDFLGWYSVTEPMLDDVSPDETSQAALVAIVDETQVTNKKSHTLYAHYRDHRYTVQFDANLPTNADVYGTRNGTLVYSNYNTPGSFTAVYNQQYNRRYEIGKLTGGGYTGTEVNLPNLNDEEYKLDNYYFIGWYLEPECKTRVYDTTRVAAQENNGDTITLYAKWIGKEKNVVYTSRIKDHPADEEYTELKIETTVQRFTSPLEKTDSFRSYFDKKVADGKKTEIEYDSPYSFPAPTRTGYTFSSWWTSFNDSTNKVAGTLLVDGNTTTEGEVSEVITPGEQKVYAEWIPNKYTVTFNANGGTVGTKEKVVTYDSKYSTLPTPTRTGYEFTGWYLTTVRTEGYGYQNSEAYVNADTWVRTASDHTLYAGWAAVVVIDASNTTNATPLNTTVTFEPTSDGGLYGESSNIAQKTVSFKTVRSLNVVGVKNTSGNWVDASEPECVPNQTVTVTTTNSKYLSVVSSLRTDANGLAEIAVVTTEEALPGSQKVTLKTVTTDWTSGVINVSLNGALTSLTLSTTDVTVYVRNDVTITATLKCTSGNGYLHSSQNKVQVTMDECDDYCTFEPTGLETGKPSIYFKAGYTVGVFSLKVTQPTSGLSTSATIRIEQPAETVKVESGGTVGSFFSNVASVYGGSATAKAKWLITGFREWEGGDPTSSATETANSSTQRDAGYKNTTDHAIYLYPIKSAIFTSSSSTAGSYSYKYIAFPTNVKYIGTNNSTTNYSSAQKVYIAGSNVYIYQYAFRNNTNSLEFKVAGSIYSVGGYAFYNCSGLYGLTSSDFSNMRTIGNYAFYNAYIGTSVSLSNCSSLGSYAFAHSSISSITSSVSSTGMCTGSSVRTANISSNYLSDDAFENCSNLYSATFSGTTIGSYAFNNCYNLYSMSMSWTQYINSYAFQNCDFYSVSFPRVISIGTAAFKNCTGLRSVSFPSSLKTIGDYAFNNTNLSGSLTLSYVTSIGSYAFYNTSLSGSLTLSSATSVGSYAFSGLSISSVKFGTSSSISLGAGAFSNCSSLSTVDFLNMGSSFNSSSFGSGVWSGCVLRYVKVTQSCFSSEETKIGAGSGSDLGKDGKPYTAINVLYGGASTDETNLYFRSPMVHFYADAWCGWTSIFRTCDGKGCVRSWIAYSSTSGGIQQYKDWYGSTPSSSSFNKTMNPSSKNGHIDQSITVYGYYIQGNCGAWNVSTGECGDFYIVYYGLGNSKCTWFYNNKIKNSGYKFAGGATSAYQRSSYSTSTYCNDYVYPGKLDNLLPIN